MQTLYPFLKAYSFAKYTRDLDNFYQIIHKRNASAGFKNINSNCSVSYKNEAD